MPSKSAARDVCVQTINTERVDKERLNVEFVKYPAPPKTIDLVVEL